MDDRRLAAGDVLLVRTTPEEIVTIRQEPGLELHPVEQYRASVAQADVPSDEDLAERLVQAVVAPDAEFIGRTIADVDFRRRYGVIVLGLWRRRGWLGQELAHTRLAAGDVLVLQGSGEALARVDADRNVLMMVPFHGEAQRRHRATLAGAIMIATVLLAAFEVLSIEMASLAGAAAMVLARCLTPGQAYRAIDARIYVFIAGAIPLGTAMKKSGASALMAGWLQAWAGGLDQWLVLAVLFAVVAVITQFVSDSATTALIAPIAAALAQALGHVPEPYVVTVAMAGREHAITIHEIVH